MRTKLRFEQFEQLTFSNGRTRAQLANRQKKCNNAHNWKKKLKKSTEAVCDSI